MTIWSATDDKLHSRVVTIDEMKTLENVVSAVLLPESTSWLRNTCNGKKCEKLQ